MKDTKKIVGLIAMFVLVFGIGFFNVPTTHAAANTDEICDIGESYNIDRVDNTTKEPPPDGIADDCDGICDTTDDDPKSVDCDPLGQQPSQNLQLGREADPRVTVMRIINVALGFLGTIAVIIILYGGFKWMTSQGSEDKVSEARKLMFMGIVGLAIVLAAYSITTFVIQGLLEATQ